jgi:ubiquinone/menaquinone biosynthesis C-methylase UbiE
MAGKVIDSLLFICAGMLLSIVSLVAFPLAAKEKVQKRRLRREAGSFLADKKRALAYYNVLSSVYDVLNPYLYTSSMRGEVAKLVDRDEPLLVLDVGCGTGYTTEGVLRRLDVCEVVGVDLNPRQLGKALRNLGLERARTSLSRGDVENLPFKNETFDAVVSVGAIEYFPNPERALKEMSRVVKSNGVVVVGGPEFGWFKKFALNRIFYTPSAEEVEDLFRKAGLDCLESEMVGVDTFFGTARYVFVVAGTKI